MEEKKIYSAICGVMADVGAVGKNKKNTQQNFMYRGVDDVMNALSPALTKNKVFIVPEVIHEERQERTNSKGTVIFCTRLSVKYRFYSDDGSFVEAVVIGEAMDTGDKATNKALAIAYKYACFQVFNIPTEEFNDSDGESHEISPENHQDDPLIDDVKKKVLLIKMKEADVTMEQILETVNGADSVDQITTTQWVKLIKKLDATIEKHKEQNKELDLGL